MTTEVLYKKIYKILIISIAFSIVGFSFVYAVYLSSATIVDTKRTFYFLVSSSTHIEASAHDVTQMGGAGYLLEENEKEYVAISVYSSRNQAVAISTVLTNAPTKILIKEASKLYLKSVKQKRQMQTYKNAFLLLSNWIDFLEQEIKRLEKGATQQSCKRILQSLQKQFVVGNRYETVFPSFTQTCLMANESLSDILHSIVYVADLRYLLCELSDGYIRLSEEFSI